MKKVLILLAALSVFSASVIAEETTQKRNVSFYLDAISGQLAPGNWVSKKEGVPDKISKVMDGNEYSFGIRYSQNFKQVPWLSVGGTFDVTWNYNPVHTADRQFVGFEPGKAPVGLKANAWVSVPYFQLLLDTRGLMGAYVNWSKSFGNAGSLGLGAELEYFFMGSPLYGNNSTPQGSYSGTNAVNPNYIVDYFGLLISYSVNLPKGFAFTTTLNPRMDANRGNGWASVEKDAANSLHLRWNNTVSLTVDSWSGYIQLRYDAFNLAHKDYEVANMFQLIAGMSYMIDVAK